MKRIVLLVLLVGISGAWCNPAWSQNPFTSSRKEAPRKAPEPLIKGAFFAKIIFWQYQLKQKMSALIRVARHEGKTQPLIMLIGLAFIYGVIHAAGPGHGKVVAMSYVLSHRATVWRGILFGLCFALIHAFSGAVGVLGLRYIIQRSVSETLASVTTVTQMVSFGLITLMGLGILVKHGYALLNPQTSGQDEKSDPASGKRVLAWAMTVGLVPCPAVVMVMLFCLSMDAVILGLLLAACISLGMATTISLVVIFIILGKTGVLRAISKDYAIRVEEIIGLLSGTAISLFGAVFLFAAISSVQH
jgi:nickel/cobalt exporter